MLEVTVVRTMLRRPTPQRLRRYWDSHADRYDKEMSFFDRRLFADNRQWVCSRATGRVLEVAIGTGLNLSHYPKDIQLTGLEFSPVMMDHARRRADDLGCDVALVEGDAQALPFDDASFDTVVCTYGLCAVPDDRQAVTEMVRILRPGGLLLLADHVEASHWPARAVQALLDLVTIPQAEEHFRRRPIRHIEALGLTIEAHDRFTLGIVERVAARKPRSEN
jgi:ubiquinone/menaquinone biosynthesis C-methylase UbiE